MTPQPARPMHAVFARRAPGRSTLFTAVALLFCVSLALHAQDEDAEVLSAALRHYSNSKRNPLLVIAAETIETGRISLGRFERAEAPEIPVSIRRELHNRSLKARPIAGIQLPANAMIVREAISMTRHVTPGGAEVADWSPFTHAYPGYRLLQLSVPAYFTPGQKALVYFWAGIGPEGTQGWLYILEKRGSEWHVTWSDSPWIS